MEFQELFESYDKDGLLANVFTSEFYDELGKICEEKKQEGYELAVQKMTEEREQAIQEKLDEARAEFDKEVEKLDEEHVGKLQELEDLFKASLEAKLTEDVEEFIEAKLSESIPQEIYVDKKRMELLESTFKSLKDTLVVTEEDVQKAVMEAKEVSETKVKDLEAKLDEECAKRLEIQIAKEKLESDKLISEKTQDMDADKALHIKTVFEGKKCSEILEKLDEAVAAYDEKFEAERQKLAEESEATEVPTEMITESKKSGFEGLQAIWKQVSNK